MKELVSNQSVIYSSETKGPQRLALSVSSSQSVANKVLRVLTFCSSA